MRIQRAPCMLAALLLSGLALASAAGEQPPAPHEDAALLIDLQSGRQVFSAGESALGSVALPPGVGLVEQLVLQWRLTPARSGIVLHQGTHTARLAAAADQTPAIPFEIPLPVEEGVYDLEIALFAGAQSRHGTVQVIVVSPLPRHMSRDSRSPPRLVDALSIPDDGPSSADRAVRIRAGRRGFPHRIVASFPRTAAESELTVVDAVDEAEIAPRAQAPPSFAPAAEAASLKTREFIFWPSGESALLFFQHAGRPSRIDVYELSSLSPAPSPSVLDENLPTRWIGPRLRSADLDQQFATGGDHAGPGGWTELHAGGLRLVEALHSSGANALMLAVPVSTAGLEHPIADQQPGKDVVEFLYRLFQRESLILLPELEFSLPLPALEALRAEGGSTARGIELIGRDGRTWREHNASHPAGPLYNPLHPAVQEAVLAALRDFVQRYAPGDAFRGVAVDVTPAGYLQYPGLDWGYDAETVSRFERETNLTVPAGPAEDRHARRYDFLTGPARSQWLRWRTAELSAFHRRMADLVTAAKPGARLFLSGDGLIAEHGQPADLFVDRRLDRADKPALPGLPGAARSPSSERLAHALAAADLQMAFAADWIVTRGNDPGSWKLRRTLQALPAITFHRHEPVPQPVVIRIGKAGESTFVYALNELPGHVTVDVQLSCRADTRCRPLGDSAPAELAEGTASGSRLRLQLEPCGLWAGEIAAAALQITGVTVTVAEPATARLRSRMTRFAARVTEIQQAGRPAPEVHSIPITPDDSRAVEPTSVAPGQAMLWHWHAPPEVGITLTAGREPAGPPPQLIVSLVARAETDSTPLRVTVESEASGEAQSDPVLLQMSRSMRRYSLPSRVLSRQGNVALRIENRGSAMVWIDALELRAYRITPDDLRELTKTVSALSLAWEERRYADCHRLLESEWGRLPFDEAAASSSIAEPVQTPRAPRSPTRP